MIIQEHKSSSYAPRTYHNASQGVTLAVAVDFNTAGEKLTHKASKHGIVQVPFHTDYVVGARELYSLLKKKDCHTLNIAGNGIYTMKKKGVDQHTLNVYMYSLVSLVHKHWPLELIVSGGQTGADIAGLVVAEVLDIECVGTWPKGYKMRFEDGVDVEMSEVWIREYISEQVWTLKEYV